MGKRVVVTGGSGFIGSHVVDVLVEAGHEVTIVDHRVPPHRGDVGFEDVDLLDLSSVVAVTRGVDHVFHLGAVANVNYANKYPVYTTGLQRHGHGQRPRGGAYQRSRSRAPGVERLGLQRGARRRHGGRVGAILPERRRPPVHLHEDCRGDAVSQLPQLYGVPFTVLRYGIPYGPRMREELLIPLFIKKALAGEPLTVAGSGSQYRRFVYVRDLASAHVLAMSDRAAQQTYNLEGSRKITVLEVARGIRQLIGERVRIDFVPSGRATSLAARCAPTRPARSSGGRRRSTSTTACAIRSGGSAQSGATRSAMATGDSTPATVTARGPIRPPTSPRRARAGARSMAARRPPAPSTGAAGA